MFLTADGESGKAGGNETIRVDAAGRLRVKVPAALANECGTHLVIAAPVCFSHRGAEWGARVSARHAVRYDIDYDPGHRRWYLDASWATSLAGTRARRRAGRAGAGGGPQCRHLAAVCSTPRA